ncbi:hypothetical protein N0V93_001608 [Gnomoniopsis smithogilvyi]|uniref:Uncharacterized protein n=1 Tax=Gnomoniopsis smithogilvyi TaxID=1191159 RepID=A0A9W9D1D3_9PEZI|nr:hypothetical protein N0V93_001608 [Gnomoniopsis smithogilvyi]
MSSNPRKRSALDEPEKELSVAKGPKKPQSNQKSKPITAWDAVNAHYPAEISSFFPSLDSIPDSLTIVKHLASLPAVKGALDAHDQPIGNRTFTLELGSKGSIKSGDKYGHFHARNRSSRAQGNLKAVLAQASGSSAHIADDQHSAQAASQKSVESSAGSGLTSHQSTASETDLDLKPDGDLKEEPTTSELGGDKMQRLLTENDMLRTQNDMLQARVEELEDMIEAEEQQCTI